MPLYHIKFMVAYGDQVKDRFLYRNTLNNNFLKKLRLDRIDLIYLR